MYEFVFSTYVTLIKGAWKETIANNDLIQLLLDAVVMPLSLTDKNGEYITIKKETASRLINRYDNVSPRIRNEADNPTVRISIVDYFRDVIVSELLIGSEDELIHQMMRIINSDILISAIKKDELGNLGQKNTLANFLASAFLYVITRKNKAEKNYEVPMTDSEESEHGSYRRKPLIVLIPPVKIAKEETPYIAALMKSYGEVEQTKLFNVEMLNLYPEYKKHFIKQREYYHLAESIRRGTRDMYSVNDPDQFEVLKDETYEGVVEIWEEKYDCGLSRIRKVMAQAAVIRADKCWLSRDTDWIGNPQKKGVCHFLVNDNRLEGWVKDDE